MTPALAELAASSRERVDRALTTLLHTQAPQPPRLAEAMAYALLGGGKRMRPLLVYAAHGLFSDDPAGADTPACAVELIHAYSLVHDDLPAMDDDDLRRGRPTCHIAFDEATAILVGDALQTLAFEHLTTAPQAAATRLAMVAALARAAGAVGMVAGQALDLGAVNQQRDLAALEAMHRAKTGALIRASIALGALAGGADDRQRATLDRYADALGLAFQVHDDILDQTADTAVLGKRAGADAARNKPTYVSLLGLDGARAKARDLVSAAVDALSAFGAAAEPLRALAAYSIERDH